MTRFDYVRDQDIQLTEKKVVRYPVEPFESVGYFEILEKEGSELDQLWQKSPELEFNIKGPLNKYKYLGNAQFYK